MKSTSVSIGLIMVVLGVASANANEANMDGLALYKKECSVCHGGIADAKTGGRAPAMQRPVQWAMASNDSAMADLPRLQASDWHDVSAANDWQRYAIRDRLAVAPIYGPPLRGVIGRPAASIKGYIYSKAFVEKMTGVVWDEAKLEKWITSAQTMVPGSFMFVSIKNQEVRKQIIEYLKAQTD